MSSSSDKKVNAWKKKMDNYRKSVTKEKFITDLKHAGYTVKNKHEK
jgi:hypothetical protein